MSSKIKIAHICDIHIALCNSLSRNIDVRGNFERVLQKVKSDRPDLIVLGGDLAAVNGETDAYEWTRYQLDGAVVPYLMIPGNHDQVDNMVSIFKPAIKGEDNKLYFTCEVMGKRLTFLDSSSEFITSDQFAWLSENNRDQPSLLFMHHPPTDCGCDFMDLRYPLQNQSETMSALNDINGLKAVFCGHYHTEKTVLSGDKTIFITPSTMMQLNQDNSEYEVSSFQPGWRIIEWDGSRIETRVEFLRNF